MVRTYFGVNIIPATSGARRMFGARWEAYVGRFLYADTLDGIKKLIREYR
jgi:hypothetical protein